MFKLSVEAWKRAYCPYSKFAVGCCLLAANGKLYTGCNVEKSVNGMSLCAEGTAIVKMVEDGCTEIKEIFVVTGLENQPPAAPCGLCRQHIKEFSHDDVN
jgi:cytidine deaminase